MNKLKKKLRTKSSLITKWTHTGATQQIVSQYVHITYITKEKKRRENKVIKKFDQKEIHSLPYIHKTQPKVNNS